MREWVRMGEGGGHRLAKNESSPVWGISCLIKELYANIRERVTVYPVTKVN